MNHRKSLAFLLTCLFFSPLLLFAVFNEPEKLEIKGDERISLVLAQFVAQGEIINTPAPTPPAPVQEEIKPEPVKEKKQKPKKKPVEQKHARKVSKPKKEINEEKLQSAQAPAGAQVVSNTPTQIGTLAVGKSDVPFLRAVKRAVDNAALKSYPRQAIRMNLTGRVLISFVWLYGHKLGKIEVIKSSGHQILDDNVFKIIKKAAQNFPPYHKTVRIEMPIDYNLVQR